MADNVLEAYTFSFRDAKPASIGCSSRVWVFPTSILQSKIRVCGAQRSNESPSGAFKRQNGLRQQMEGPSPDKFADVYTSALLATRKWSCLLNNCHRTETSPAPSQCSAPTLDEWSAFATFLADVIEKHASVLEIDSAVSSTTNENQQDAVDTALAA